jgi:hypothetical protein
MQRIANDERHSYRGAGQARRCPLEDGTLVSSYHTKSHLMARKVP